MFELFLRATIIVLPIAMGAFIYLDGVNNGDWPAKFWRRRK